MSSRRTPSDCRVAWQRGEDAGSQSVMVELATATLLITFACSDPLIGFAYVLRALRR